MKFPSVNRNKTIFLVVGIIILIVLFKSFGVEKIIDHFRTMSWKFFIIIALFLFNNMFLSISWKIIINYPVKWRDYGKLLLARIAGDSTSSINSLGALAGEPIKAMYMKDIIPFRTGLASVVLDRTLHTISNMLLFFTGVIISFFVLEIPVIVSFAALSFFIIMFSVMMLILKKQRDGFLEYLLSLLPERISKKIMSEERWEKTRALDKEIGFLLSNEDKRKNFFYSLAIRYVSVLITGTLEIYLIIKFINIDIPITYSLFIYIFNLFLTGIIFFMPANLGTSEGAFTLALQFFGYDPAIGITLGIIQRLRRFVWAGIGMLILFHAGLIKKEKKNGSENISTETG